MITSSPTLKKANKTILVVDDSVDMRALLSQALSLESYRVITASNGKEALELLEKKTCPDLVLVDLSMPEMDGKEFVRRLHQYPGCGGTKVVLISGWDDLEQKSKALQADGYLRKPIDLQNLYQQIPRYLDSSREL